MLSKTTWQTDFFVNYGYHPSSLASGEKQNIWKLKGNEEKGNVYGCHVDMNHDIEEHDLEYAKVMAMHSSKCFPINFTFWWYFYCIRFHIISLFILKYWKKKQIRYSKISDLWHNIYIMLFYLNKSYPNLKFFLVLGIKFSTPCFPDRRCTAVIIPVPPNLDWTD